MAMNTQHKMGMNGIVKSGGEKETMDIFQRERTCLRRPQQPIIPDQVIIERKIQSYLKCGQSRPRTAISAVRRLFSSGFGPTNPFPLRYCLFSRAGLRSSGPWFGQKLRPDPNRTEKARITFRGYAWQNIFSPCWVLYLIFTSKTLTCT